MARRLRGGWSSGGGARSSLRDMRARSLQRMVRRCGFWHWIMGLD